MREPPVEEGDGLRAVPLVLALENVVHEAAPRLPGLVDQSGPAHRLGGGRHREEEVLGPRLDEEGARRDQRTQILVFEAAEHAEEDLGTAHVPGHLVALGPATRSTR